LVLRDADSPEAIAAYLARNPGLSFIALSQSQLIGCLLAGTDGRRGYLQHLVVRENHRGQGVGRALLQAATQALQAIGIDKTHLLVLADNEPALAFYRHLGWTERSDVRLFSYTSSGNPHS
jgi:ribosomal protein S18 acetylase RimI-like enzyme